MATPVFCCGFECGRLGNVGQHWNGAVGGLIDTTIKRSGARSCKSDTNNIITRSFTGGNDTVFRGYVYFETLPTSDMNLFYVDASAVGYGFKFFVTDNSVRTFAGNSNGASGTVVTTGQWYLLDCYVSSGPGTTQTTQAKIDGVTIATATRSPFSGAATSSMGFRGGIFDVGTAYLDDVMMSLTAGDYPLGAGYINHFVPIADGTHNVAGANDFERGTTGTDIINSTTTAYQLIDDVPMDDTTPDTDDFINMIAPPNATDYTEHIFGPAPGIATPVAAPRAVEVAVAYHQAGTGNGNMELLLNDNGTTNAIVTLSGVAGTTTIRYSTKQYATGPAGAWVIGGGGNGDFTDLRIRFRSGAVVDANPDQYFDCAMIEAEFQEPPIPPGLGPAVGQYGSIMYMDGAGGALYRY